MPIFLYKFISITSWTLITNLYVTANYQVQGIHTITNISTALSHLRFYLLWNVFVQANIVYTVVAQG